MLFDPLTDISDPLTKIFLGGNMDMDQESLLKEDNLHLVPVWQKAKLHLSNNEHDGRLPYASA